MKKNLLGLIIFLILNLSFSWCYAEVFYLKSGDIVKGKISEETEKRYKIENGVVCDKDGQELFYFPRYYIRKDEIVRMEAAEESRKNYLAGEPIDREAIERRQKDFFENVLPKMEERIAKSRETVDMEDGSQVLRQYYPNGELWMEVALRNGQKDGIVKSYYENG